MLKLQCHYASLGKFYKLNMWIVPASLYSKARAIFALPCSAARFLDFSIIEGDKLLYTTS